MYNNPYNQYPYTMYGNNNQQPNMYQQPQQPMQMQMAQPKFWSLVLVDNFDEVNRYIVQPNQVIYLKVRNTNCIYEKSANNQGEYTLNEYGKIEPVQQQTQKQEKVEYVPMATFNQFGQGLEQRINKLSQDLEKVLKGQKGEE